MADKKSGTRKKTGISEFKKMVKALKLSKDEIADILGHTRLNPETGMREHRKGGGLVVEKKFGKLIKGAVKSLNKKRKKKPFDPAERSAKDAYIIGGTGTVGIGGAATLGHKDAVKKSKQKKEGRSRNIGGKDVSKMPIKKKANGSLVGGQKKLDVNKDGKITGSDFEMLKMNKKKYGGKISYRMKGGQVVDSSYD